MLDTAASFMGYNESQARRDTPNFKNGLANPVSRSEAVMLNGSQLVTRSPTPRSPVEPLNVPSTPPRQRSDDPAGLVKEVNSLLKIDSPPNGTLAPETKDGLIVDAHTPKIHQLQVAMLPTGICYDVRMRFHCELQPHQRPDDHHPEDPRRIFCIYQALCEAGLVDDPVLSTRPLVPQPMVKILARDATPQEICLVHDARHYTFMDNLRRKCPSKCGSPRLIALRYPGDVSTGVREAI